MVAEGSRAEGPRHLASSMSEIPETIGNEGDFVRYQSRCCRTRVPLGCKRLSKPSTRLAGPSSGRRGLCETRSGVCASRSGLTSGIGRSGSHAHGFSRRFCRTNPKSARDCFLQNEPKNPATHGSVSMLTATARRGRCSIFERIPCMRTCCWDRLSKTGFSFCQHGRFNDVHLSHLLITAALLVLAALQATPAMAQRVFVAAQGSDANPCTFAAPCRTCSSARTIRSRPVARSMCSTRRATAS